MIAVLLKAFSFIFIIFLGYTLKKSNFFKPTDYILISKITMNITLPAAVVTAFANFKKDGSLFMLVLLGFILNLFMISLGYIISRRRVPEAKAFYMINIPGYNIGTFTLPFVQNFLGPFGVIAACMFDTGNAIMCTGGSYAITSNIVDEKSKLNITFLAKKLLSSITFDSYMFMLMISVIGIRIPSSLTTVISTIASANGFLAMLMLGMMFEVKLEAKYIKAVSITILIRYLAAGTLSAIFYFCTPFSLIIRQVLSIIVFAPISGLAPLFTEMCGGDSSLSSFASSITILISIAIMTTLIVVMKIGM